MVQLQEKKDAAIMLSSYFETVGFKNGIWEFNYNLEVYDIRKYINMLNTMVQQFLILGGASNINVKEWLASDDTILILAIGDAVLKGGGEENYIKSLVKYYDLLQDKRRVSGIVTLDIISKLKKGYKLKNIDVNSSMGGNGAAIRTGPIGIKW